MNILSEVLFAFLFLVFCFYAVDKFCSLVTRFAIRSQLLEKHSKIVTSTIKNSLIFKYTDEAEATRHMVNSGICAVFLSMLTECRSAKVSNLDIVLYFNLHVKIPDVKFKICGDCIALQLKSGTFLITDNFHQNDHTS